MCLLGGTCASSILFITPLLRLSLHAATMLPTTAVANPLLGASFSLHLTLPQLMALEALKAAEDAQAARSCAPGIPSKGKSFHAGAALQRLAANDAVSQRIAHTRGARCRVEDVPVAVS